MNRDPLARAILAACIVSALLAPGFLLSRGALSAPVSPGQHFDTYLPIIFGNDSLPEDLTATAVAATTIATTAATATTTTTATGSATTTKTTTTTATGSATATKTTTATATGSATATKTATPAGTGTATTTPTATATATATPSPTFDAQATAQLQIANLTGFALTFTLVGPTNASGEVKPNESLLISIQPGHYTLTAETHCQTVPVEFDIASGQSLQETYNCP